MSADDIIAIINAIPQYIEYFYPGYITIYVYCFLRAKHVSDTKAVIFKSLGISYVYSIVLGKIESSLGLMYNFWLIILSIFVAYMAYLFTKSEITEDIFYALDVETRFWDNEIEALQGFNNGAWLVVYLRNDNVYYEGNLHHKELEEGKKQYISLSGYRKYFLNADGSTSRMIEDCSNNLNEEVVIFYEDIKKIEKRQ